MKQNLTSNEQPHYIWKHFAAILTLLYFISIILLFYLDINKVYEPPLVLSIMNTIFLAFIPLVVLIIAAKSYLFSGLNSLLFIGCSMIAFGCGSLLGGWVIAGQNGPNMTVTIHNMGAFLGSIFYFLSSISTFNKDISETIQERRRFILGLAYSGMLFLIIFITLATLWGITPKFFIQGVGPTLLRQSVLGMAVALYFLSALIYLRSFTKRKISFYYWHFLSLFMIALGLTAIFVQKSVGSPIGWLGRFGQFIGCIYAMIAVFIIFKSARNKGESMQSAVTDLFRDAKLSYHALVETVIDPIISFGQEGKIFQWNSAAEKVFGYRENEALGASIFDLIISQAFIEVFRKEIDNLKVVDSKMKIRSSMELTGKTKDGSIIPLEVSSSAMNMRDKRSFICVFRDITERKMADAEIKKINEELESKVIERTAQLNVLNLELKSQISVRVEAESIANESRALLQSVINSTTDSFYMKDTQGRYMMFNTAAEIIVGKCAADVLGKDDYSIFPPDEAAVIMDGDRKVMENGEIATYEEYLSDAAGKFITFLSTKGPIYDSNGKLLGLFGFARDITLRKQAEDKLKDMIAETHLLREALDYVSSYIYIKDTQSRYLYANQPTLELFGCSAEGLVGSDDTRFFPIDAAKRLREIDSRVLLGEKTTEEIDSVKAGGERHIYWEIKTPIYDQSDSRKVSGLLGISTDITAIKMTEEALLNEKQRLSNIVDGTQAGTWEWNVQTGEAIFNEQWAGIIGYTLEELSPISIETWMKFANPDDLQKSEELLESHFRGDSQQYTFESRMKHKDGHWVWVLDRGKVASWAEDGKPLWMFGTHQDITEIKLAEKSLRESEKEFRTLAESMPQIVWITRPDGWYIYFNQQWMDYTGLTLEESCGNGWNKPFHPDDRQRAWDAWQNATENLAIYEIECQLRRADGVYNWWLIRGVPVLDSSGNVLKWFGTCTDINERKQTEEEIKRLNIGLEERVQERTMQMQASIKELEAYSYTVSHDLRAPLRHIDGYVNLLVSRCSDSLNEKGLHYLEAIADSTTQMGVLIDNLLEFSRMGQIELRRETLDMNLALQEALSILKESVSGRTIKWVIADLPSVQGDYALLRQVWFNLLDNAIKYTRQNEDAHIEISSREENGEVIFAVEDNGVGFDMLYADELFGVFKRLHSMEEFEGTGIGLATVQRIITRHGGSVWAEAEMNKGARFYFTLPILKENNYD